MTHYLEALDFQLQIMRIRTIFCGKDPHPNWLVGGVPCAINVSGEGAASAINMERLNFVRSIIDDTNEFVENVYIPARPRAGRAMPWKSGRSVVGYAKGDKEITEQLNFVLKILDVPVTALFSTLGRTAARGLECQWAANKMSYFMDKLIANVKAGDTATANVDKWEPKTWPAELAVGLATPALDLL